MEAVEEVEQPFAVVVAMNDDVVVVAVVPGNAFDAVELVVVQALLQAVVEATFEAAVVEDEVCL